MGFTHIVYCINNGLESLNGVLLGIIQLVHKYSRKTHWIKVDSAKSENQMMWYLDHRTPSLSSFPTGGHGRSDQVARRKSISHRCCNHGLIFSSVKYGSEGKVKTAGTVPVFSYWTQRYYYVDPEDYHAPLQLLAFGSSCNIIEIKYWF